LHPRKNLANLFEAFDIYKADDQLSTRLVIVGAKKWWTPAIREAYTNMKFRDDVVFAGRLNDSDLNLAIGGALAMAYVSYFEGFGIPIVESFRCRTPVITSCVTSMPEVAGDAALLCDPFHPASIADAMQRLATDEALRTELIEKADKRRDVFTWDRTAELLWSSIEKASAT
jgi:glycosyltransferase involved in cell wall biosynthesis